LIKLYSTPQDRPQSSEFTPLKYSFPKYSPSDEDFQTWDRNLSRWFRSDKFMLHTGIFELEDGKEKEKVILCAGGTVGDYMLRTGYRLIIDYLKQNSLETPVNGLPNRQ